MSQEESSNNEWSTSRILRGLDRFLSAATIACAFAMLVVVTLQIVSRFALTQAPSWTEEVSRALFIYTVSFGAALGIRTQSYVGFDSLLHLLPNNFRRVMQCIIYLLIAIFMGILFWHSLFFVKLGHLRTAASLPMKMSSVYMSITILSAATFVYSLVEIWNLVFSGPSSGEST